jgi:hypothetical protein
MNIIRYQQSGSVSNLNILSQVGVGGKLYAFNILLFFYLCVTVMIACA